MGAAGADPGAHNPPPPASQPALTLQQGSQDAQACQSAKARRHQPASPAAAAGPTWVQQGPTQDATTRRHQPASQPSRYSRVHRVHRLARMPKPATSSGAITSARMTTTRCP